MYTCEPSTGKLGAGDREFKVNLGYIKRSRTAWDTCDPVSK